MKVFIGGSIGTNNLDDAVKTELNKYMQSNFEILIGDAYGIDSSVQKYLNENGYGNVKVYASNGRARNNIGGWKVVAINVPYYIHGREFYAQKDIAMTADCDYGFMIWNGKSQGTLANIKRLIEYGKSVAVFLTESKQIKRIKDFNDYRKLAEEL